ncbi:TIGR02757 family protein [Aquimarina algicola]|uniref:TIGR02757 family protein n=1 Tax=Aquimarina algicola TaxID=2589995 RepID=A0A504JPH7_9FLAO|nr:TIGR02757 family protein [Aquimarina algicola]TPN88699.1 TIGR02757 family protein [Aquimarina algicola]
MKRLKKSELKDFLDEKAAFYENPKFIETDPVQIPHLFTQKEDIEIAGFLTATISWGNRKSILTNAHKLMSILGDSPYDFIMTHPKIEPEDLNDFVHRTFNTHDLAYFITGLHRLYTKYGDMESFFTQFKSENSLQNAIHHFKREFFVLPHLSRTEKHISDPQKKSAAKRINMFLRWMVRNPKAGVDLGIWKTLSPSQLSCPLDVHSGNVARKLKILNRKQNDSVALLELDTALRKLDPNDPVKYDYALFGLGVFEKF